MAVDSMGKAIEYSSGIWAKPTLVVCMAVDTAGNTLQFNGTTKKWSTPQLLLSKDNSTFSVVSSASAKFCVAGINAANASPYIGDVAMYTGTWKTQHVDSTGNGSDEDLVSVSCSTQYYCAAGDNQGNAVVYDTRLTSKSVLSVPSRLALATTLTAKVTVSGLVTGSGQPAPTGSATVTVGPKHCTLGRGQAAAQPNSPPPTAPRAPAAAVRAAPAPVATRPSGRGARS